MNKHIFRPKSYSSFIMVIIIWSALWPERREKKCFWRQRCLWVFLMDQSLTHRIINEIHKISWLKKPLGVLIRDRSNCSSISDAFNVLIPATLPKNLMAFHQSEKNIQFIWHFIASNNIEFPNRNVFKNESIIRMLISFTLNPHLLHSEITSRILRFLAAQWKRI